MKNTVKILSSLLVLLLVACGNSQKKGGTDSTDTYMTDPAINDKDSNNDNMSNDGAMNNTQDPDLNQEEYDIQRNKQMYSSLNMTDEQIQRYETAMHTSMDTWERNNPQKTITIKDRMKIQRDNLVPILDESQFRNYEQWANDNPYRD